MCCRLKNSIPSKDELEKEVQTLKEHLVSLNSPVVFSHNDLLLKNIIYNKEKGKDISYFDLSLKICAYMINKC